MGGEEFLMIMVDVNDHSAAKAADNIRRAIVAETFRLPQDVTMHLTVSLGLAVYNGHPDYQQLLRRADDALYEAKNNGRNRVVIAPACLQRDSPVHSLEDIRREVVRRRRFPLECAPSSTDRLRPSISSRSVPASGLLQRPPPRAAGSALLPWPGPHSSSIPQSLPRWRCSATSAPASACCRNRSA